jgi:hypothetical protein
MHFPHWPNVTLVVTDEDYPVFWHEAAEAQKGPEVPPEVWQTAPADGDRCMAATKALCG